MYCSVFLCEHTTDLYYALNCVLYTKELFPEYNCVCVCTLQAKKAIKEVPKDDEEVDRQEEGEIDRGFTESSSSGEDELTEAGE